MRGGKFAVAFDADDAADGVSVGGKPGFELFEYSHSFDESVHGKDASVFRFL